MNKNDTVATIKFRLIQVNFPGEFRLIDLMLKLLRILGISIEHSEQLEARHQSSNVVFYAEGGWLFTALVGVAPLNPAA